MALHAFLKYKGGPIGGLIGFSGFFMEDPTRKDLDLDKITGKLTTPVLFYHGLQDSMLTVVRACNSYQKLKYAECVNYELQGE
jgi:predicted esterase